MISLSTISHFTTCFVCFLIMITIEHNLYPKHFRWLWAKYVISGNATKHCTNSIRGVYSKKFSKTSNPNLANDHIIAMDEVPEEQYKAIYFCGVSNHLYHKHLNYDHNMHLAVEPCMGQNDIYQFENWRVVVHNGKILHIPDEEELDPKFFREPYNADFYTCRIFRWAVSYFGYNHPD